MQLDTASSGIAIDRVDLPELHVVDLVTEQSVRRDHVLDRAVAQKALIGGILGELLVDRAAHADVAHDRPECVGQAGDAFEVRSDRRLVQHLQMVGLAEAVHDELVVAAAVGIAAAEVIRDADVVVSDLVAHLADEVVDLAIDRVALE